jgi:hypothetical protein
MPKTPDVTVFSYAFGVALAARVITWCQPLDMRTDAAGRLFQGAAHQCLGFFSPAVQLVGGAGMFFGGGGRGGASYEAVDDFIANVIRWVNNFFL